MKGARGVRPTFGDGFLLHRRQTGPLRLPGCIGVNVEEPAQDREILLVEDKGGNFPEAVVQAMLQVVLSGTQDGAKQLRAGIVRDRLAGVPNGRPYSSCNSTPSSLDRQTNNGSACPR